MTPLGPLGDAGPLGDLVATNPLAIEDTAPVCGLVPCALIPWDCILTP